MKHICLQAGHENCQYNSIVRLRRSTGAPNEMAFNVDIRNQVAGELRKKGFQVTTTDANANDNKEITKTNFDLFLAIHYDADIYNEGGGFVDRPNPDSDGAALESKRIMDVFEEEYFKVTAIKNKPNRRNDNTKYYYMWKYLTAKTPCVIIECGVGMHVPDDHTILHFNRPLVVEGIVRSICKAFNVDYDQKPEVPVESEADKLRKENSDLRKENGELKSERKIDKDTILKLATAIEQAKQALDVDVTA